MADEDHAQAEPIDEGRDPELDGLHDARAPVWPDRDLIRAAAGGTRALSAWSRWQHRRDFDGLKRGQSCLLGPVHAHLRHLSRAVPSSDHLRTHYFRAWSRTRWVLHGASRVLDTFTAAELPCMVVKGIALALFHYRDLGARTMADADLLVPIERVGLAMRLLRDLGWRPKSREPGAELWPHVQSCSYQLDASVEIDLHWHPFQIDSTLRSVQGMWESARSCSFEGRAFLVPDALDSLLMMCVQAYRRDESARLRWMVDARLLATELVQQDRVATFVQRAHDSGLLGLAFDCSQLSRWVGVAWPESLEAGLLRRLDAFLVKAPIRRAARLDPERRDHSVSSTPRQMLHVAVEQCQLHFDVARLHAPGVRPRKALGTISSYLLHRWQLDGLGEVGPELLRRLRRTR